MTDDNFELQDELGAYLLGALSPEEARRVEELLETSDAARERIRYMQPAVELLAEAVERREPPPALRQRILNEVGIDEPVMASPAEPKRSRKRWFSLDGFSLQPAMGLAAVLLVAVVGVVGYEVGLGGGDDGPRVFKNPPPDDPGQTVAQLRINGDDGTLELTNLKDIPADEDYQAWVQKDGEMLPSSLFAVRSNGTASAAIPHDLVGAEAVVVTAEPRGGSQTPTGPVIASVPLSS